MPYQNILITGANRGLGFGLVKQYLALKNPPKNLIATTRSESEPLNELKASHPNLHIAKLECLDYDHFGSFVDIVKRIVKNDGLDLLINNAGILLHDELETLDPSNLMKSIENNAVAPMILTKHLLPLLRESAKIRRTVVVQMSSRLGSIENHSGDHTYGFGYGYRVSKTALNMLSKSLAMDLKSDNITVVILHPSWVKTDLGGPDAFITTEVSCAGMVKVIEDASIDKTGQFVTYLGETEKW